MSASLLTSSLAAELARLNARQREAVEHPDGPVLVVAGPGTGKTQLLAARVAWLLQQPDARPQEILCLTYTEAAARNMRERLLRFLGPAAHQVSIHTFHSFGQLIIHENADLLGFQDLSVASELEMQQILRELIDALPAGHLLRRNTGSVYFETKRLGSLLHRMKREGWSPNQVLEGIAAFRAGLSENKDYLYKNSASDGSYKLGDLNPRLVAVLEAKLVLTEAGVNLFDAYQLALQRRGRYDYDDMLGWAKGLLTDYPDLLQTYQERFQHFLVDEYQDTNGAQGQLLHMLASHWENPSIMAVGDDDQSIFRFQGASVANVVDFRRRYPTAHVVVLEDNYRSSAAVLKAAEALINHNQERLTKQWAQALPGFSKRLVARHPRFAASTVAAPQLRTYPTPLHEAAHVAAEVAALHRSGWPAGGGAILAHDHAQLDVLAQLLAAHGVPFYRKKKVNALAQPGLTRSVHRILQYLATVQVPNPVLAEPALFVLLHLECWAIPPVDLIRLAAGHRLRRGPRHQDLVGLPWRVWVAQVISEDELAAELQLSEPGQHALRRALETMDAWVQSAASQPIPALLELIFLQTLLPWYLPRHAGPDQLLAGARTLLQFGHDEARRQPGLNVVDFLAVWDAMAQLPEGLPLKQVVGEDSSMLQLLSAHGAKGLEFERVWVVGCQESSWVKNRAEEGYFLPKTLSQAPTKDAKQEEARRLFFVALTRAQEYLVLSYVRTNEEGKPTIKCAFVHELQAAVGLPEEVPEVAEEVLDAARRQLMAPPLPPLPHPSPVALDQLLDSFVLSASTLNAYLQCPRGFYYEHLLKVPTLSNEAMVFGTAVHDALEHYFRQAQHPSGLGFGEAHTLVAEFETRLARHRPDMSPAAYERWRLAGKDQLRAYYDRYRSSWQQTALVEQLVQARTPEGVNLTGKLDRIDRCPDGWGHDVLDYKTGNPKYANAKLTPAPFKPEATLVEWISSQEVRGGDYWRQGVFYYLLLKHDAEGRFTPASVSFDFTQPLKPPIKGVGYLRARLNIGPNDEATVLAQIKAADDAIRAHDFSQGCGICSWCRLGTSEVNESLPKRTAS